MKIVFCGGGTLGSVTPLLALYESLSLRGVSAEWIGTHNGPERVLVSGYSIPFHAIHTGKLRRYFSIQNFIDPFLLITGIVEAVIHLLRFRPDVVVNAGSYVGVPVVCAAWLLQIRVVLLQLDIEQSLSNRIVAGLASAIAVSCMAAGRAFPSKKVTLTGIPVRAAFHDLKTADREDLKKNLDVSGKKLVLILGGGTGAQSLNEMMVTVVSALPEVFFIHVTGIGKEVSFIAENYRAISFATSEMPTLCTAADVVITRSGMGALSELALLAKPCILVPLPNSHQERNASYFEKTGSALYISQLDPRFSEKITSALMRLFDHADIMDEVGTKLAQSLPSDSVSRVSELLYENSSSHTGV